MRRSAFWAKVMLLALLMIPNAGCEGWKWSGPTFASGVLVGVLIGLSSESVTIEQNCFENGVPVDCATLQQ